MLEKLYKNIKELDPTEFYQIPLDKYKVIGESFSLSSFDGLYTCISSAIFTFDTFILFQLFSVKRIHILKAHIYFDKN